MITARGDERLTKIVFWLANKGRKLFRDPSNEAGETLCKIIKKHGVEPEYIFGEIHNTDSMPTSIYKV